MSAKRAKRKPLTQEEFDNGLIYVLEGMTTEEVMAIPGVYEAVSEALNNEAIEAALEMREVGA